MNKAHTIAKWKQIEAAADTALLVLDQLNNTATRLKSEATAALRELGDSPGPGRKAPKYKLPDDVALQLKANLTRSNRKTA